MSHPMQQVRIHGIQHKFRSAKVKKCWVVRWNVDGRAHSKAFSTSNEANRYRSLLVAAQHRSERFDRRWSHGLQRFADRIAAGS